MPGSIPFLCRGLWISHGTIPTEPITSGVWVTAPCLRDGPEHPGGCWWSVQRWDQAGQAALLQVCRGWEELPRTLSPAKAKTSPVAGGREQEAGFGAESCEGHNGVNVRSGFRQKGVGLKLFC